jgi:diguanylate cyclase (GGDEF)-like protein
MRRHAAALIICTLGLLAIAMSNVLNMHAEKLLNLHAKQTARDWAVHLIESTPDLERMIADGNPASAVMQGFDSTKAIDEIHSLTILNPLGRPVYTYQPERDDKGADGKTVTAGQSVIAKSTAPIVVAGRKIGTVKINIGEEWADKLYLRAAHSGAVDILVLVNLTLLGCWFAYILLTRAAREREIHMNRYDELTGLPSRFGFVHELDKALSAPARLREDMAVLVLKIDRFRDINEAFGHPIADQVLCKVANTLQTLSEDGGFAARLSGNTFGVIFPASEGRDGTRRWAERINEALRAPVIAGGHRILPKASIGIAMSPADGKDSQTLIKHAELARFIANENGGNKCRFYDHATAAAFAELHEMETLLEKACEQESFELHFQPLYNLSTKRLCGYETLVRLRNADGEFIPPDNFIPVAEALHRIEELGTWVLRQACQLAADWPDHFIVAVNLSPLQFESGKLVEIIRSALADSGLKAKRLELEVTEGLVLEASDNTASQLKEIQDMGVKIALDDFGTGYASLSYLWQFPFDRIKIDRSFVEGMQHNERAAWILATVVDLAKNMNLPVTAEGIETPEQLEHVTSLGCTIGQGYLLGRPVPATEVAVTMLDDLKNQVSEATSSLQKVPVRNSDRIAS